MYDQLEAEFLCAGIIGQGYNEQKKQQQKLPYIECLLHAENWDRCFINTRGLIFATGGI